MESKEESKEDLAVEARRIKHLACTVRLSFVSLKIYFASISAKMADVKLFVLIAVVCALYSINIGADEKDQRKIKDVVPWLSNLLPPGEVKDKFYKLEMQDFKDTMDMIGQFYKFDNLDQWLGKLFEKNPEAANFVKLLLEKLGCPKDDQMKNCVPKLQAIKQAIKSLLDPLSSFKDQIMAALMAMIQLMQNVTITSTIMQLLTSS